MATDPEPGERTSTARLHDGTQIEVVTVGRGPHVLLLVRPRPHDPDAATAMRQWGADPDAGATLVHGLADTRTVVAADYEGHRLASPAPDTLTPDAVAADLLAVADAAGAERFVCYGYSWLALAALQLAVRTDRLTGLVMGGFPPVGGPYAEMLAVTRAAHAMAVAQSDAAAPDGPEVEPGDWSAVRVQTGSGQTRQFVTLYEALQDVDDAAASARLDVPRACFAGELDVIEYGPDWGGVRVAIGEALARYRDELQAAGWAVELLPGLDHLTAAHGDVVLPLLRRRLPVAAA
ncbi:alpha/beta hydrolase [Geodermatophilus sp. TF02-6]|uniref:alpha/beta hydrolase n=1 Tax=Geodermatophilus sp. TF02-6 TaxID=2250575 RepID=UPI000DEA1118|nr:alpha/beta hydrolase [Geodermatophilus sp. TF02-6]RBY76432.1 alpha/beta hydrolase [Geodermatophilus sp. TF02-6]